MNTLTSQEIRRRFLTFFEERDHAIIPSASLVPENDPTVLFTTAGMHPLVPYLLGESHPQGKRLASAQKCLRTGDIDEVGDNRHLTFFEMLGNWSLGDYFKKEAITWSWQFITDKEKGLGLDPKRLYVTVFAGDLDAPRDEESIAIWQELLKAAGVSAEVDKPIAEGGRIFTMNKDSNWWGPAGQTGPCGPDTEMYYDIGDESLAQTEANGFPDFESGRLVEFWNDVFMQYRKTEHGTFEPLDQHNVDTGAGFDRLCAILQGVATPFETDLFQPIMDCLNGIIPAEADVAARRIVADHMRASVMLISDGVMPSNKDRGYVLRRLIRRALLHGGFTDTAWVNNLVNTIAAIYGDAYPQLSLRAEEIAVVISEEAAKFQKSLEKGKKEIAKLDQLTAKAAFDLYQTYGFPWELTKEYAAAQGLTIEEADFEKEFDRHKNLSRTASAGQFASGLADHGEATVKFHTATHLLHQALRIVLGDGVEQRGSNITPERLRFDFSYPAKMTPEQIREVEELVNAQIKRGLPVSSATMSPEQAKAEGAIGLFGHKYGESVSVYTIGNFSKEICTGPHVKNTAELGRFLIAKEEAVSAGVRRIKAVLE